MLSMILESSQVAYILSLTIQGGGTTLISPGSRTNPQTKEELLMLKINILQDFLRHIKIMDARLSQHHHLIRPSLKPSVINIVIGRYNERVHKNDWSIN
jgi:hypothetical protein